MELQQLKFGDKVKMKLIQPQFKCSGRDEVTCYYRGKVIGKGIHFIVIEFKYNKKLIQEKYYYPLMNNEEGFIREELKDIKII